MSSQEKGDVPDLQLSFVFGNSVVKPKTPCKAPGDAEPQELPEYNSSEALCLSRTELKHVPDSIVKNISLKYLYLEGNQMSSIPGSLFISLPNLLWLDLRNNQIASLPAEIGLNRSLKTLLLEGNPISELPAELASINIAWFLYCRMTANRASLGNVITLKGLNLRNCSITFPPQDIVNQGLQSILQFLRNAMAQRPVSTRKTPPELPMVEKLQLSELMGSSVEEQEESVDEDELQRFRELKHKMNLLDKAELGSIAQGDRKPNSHLPSINRRKKTATKAGIIPALPLCDTPHWKRPEERRQAAVKELKEKQALLEQRTKSQEALRKWRTQNRIPQAKERQRKPKEAETDSKPGVEDSSATNQSQMYEENRTARKLERQIHAHIERMVERRRNPRGTAAEQMEAEGQDVREMRRLQARLLEKTRNRGRHLENCFKVLAAEFP